MFARLLVRGPRQQFDGLRVDPVCATEIFEKTAVTAVRRGHDVQARRPYQSSKIRRVDDGIVERRE